MQQFAKLVEEDLNTGAGTVWITSPGGGEVLSTQIGLHSFARGQKEYTATWAPGAIAAGASASTTLVVPDSLTTDFVLASHDKVLTNDLRISGNVSADGTVQVVVHNPTAASITVASGTVSVLALQSRPALNAFTLLNLSGNLAAPTFAVQALDMVDSTGSYDSFGIADSESGPFASSVDVACPIGAKTLYVEGRYGGVYPLVLSATFTLSDPLGFCP